MKALVLGAGLQGIATTLDLAWNKNIEKITLGDFDLEQAKKLPICAIPNMATGSIRCSAT